MHINLGITIGDPGGIGPEIVKKVCTEITDVDLTIIGSRKVLDLRADNITYLDIPYQKETITTGQPDKYNGQMSYAYILKAITLAQENKISALITAPICKESLALADIPFTGHTSILKTFTKSKQVSMAFYAKKLKTVLVTIHIPFKDVPLSLTPENLRVAINNSFLYAKLLGIIEPRIALAGLNPHAGENGLFGEEELEVLQPVLKEFQDKGQFISGPWPPDTIFHKAYYGQFDIIIALYHDQALIPMKMLAFENAVNVTLGLPFIRTSPDHGTAFDIVNQNKANPSSFREAVNLARLMIHNRLP
jgi:4-hydroxythreonine-4-phosphate dehydrogenase